MQRGLDVGCIIARIPASAAAVIQHRHPLRIEARNAAGDERSDPRNRRAPQVRSAAGRDANRSRWRSRCGSSA